MTSIFHKGRSRVALFAVVAMVASLLAVPLTAGAQTTACPSTIPSAGFTDVGTFDQETQDAIDCIAFYDVTQGTSATTYSPNDDVSRWQMALFLTRKLTTAGVTLPSGADQGFTDISTFNAETQSAINQLAQLGISKGTSATTYDPNGNVNRWQMALFLSRDLETLGVVPTGLSGVSVTPSTKASLANGAARAYTATFTKDGATYTGFVGIQLLDATSAGAPIYNDAADFVVLESVDGTANGTTEFNGFAGTDGAVNFVIRHTGTAENVVPVAWIDLDGDSGYETTGNIAPTEPFGLGGETDFSGAAAGEAGDGTYTGFIVDSVDKTGDDFEASKAATTCTNGAGALCQFDYDSNDVFLVKSVASDLTGFEAALSTTDVVNIVYDDDVAGVSTFNITTDNTAVTTLKVTTPSSATTIDANNFTVLGTGEPGYVTAIYDDADDDGVRDTGEAKLAEGTNAGGSWALTVPLQQNAVNDFVVTQRKTSGTDDVGTGVGVPAITEGAPAAAKLTSSVFTPVGAAGLSVGDVITLTFDEKIAGVGSGDSLDIKDQDASTATIVLGTDTTFALSAGDTVLTLTIVNPPFATGGTTAGILGPTQITAINGFQGDDGLAIDLTGSGGGRVFNVS